MLTALTLASYYFLFLVLVAPPLVVKAVSMLLKIKACAEEYNLIAEKHVSMLAATLSEGVEVAGVAGVVGVVGVVDGVVVAGVVDDADVADDMVSHLEFVRTFIAATVSLIVLFLAARARAFLLAAAFAASLTALSFSAAILSFEPLSEHEENVAVAFTSDPKYT